MEFKPHEYQKRAVDFVKEKPNTALLMEMGLGKTSSTLTAIRDLIFDEFAVNKVLVIAPLKVAESTWPDEIEKWDHLSSLTYTRVLGPAKQRREALEEDVDIYIINRENVVWLIEQFGAYSDKKKKHGFRFHKTTPWPFDTVVIDELSSFKSHQSKRFKMLKKALPYINRIIGLTGTPAPNGLLDLWAQIYLIDGGERLGRRITGYREKYFRPTSYIFQGGNRIPTKYAPRSGAEETIYEAIDDIAISMKSSDWLNLPKRINRTIHVDLSEKDMQSYEHLERESILSLDEGVVVAGSAAVVTQKLHQYAQGAMYLEEPTSDWIVDGRSCEEVHQEKLRACDEVIESAAGHPVLIFYWFKHDLDRLQKRYKKARTLNGPDDLKAWNAGEIPILLAHPASAGHGLNMQDGGHHILWFSLTWSLELYQQANARLDRQGQAHSVVVHHLVTRGTIDEMILQALESKKTKQEALMDAVNVLCNRYKKDRMV